MREGEEYKYYNFKFEEKNSSEMLKSNTLFLSKKDGKYGYVDKSGNVVIDYIYDDGTEQNAYGYSRSQKRRSMGHYRQHRKTCVRTKYQFRQFYLY